MKRFTDTEIWKKQWFQDLEPKHKMVWFYLKDMCDNVGVWSVNKRLAEFQIGEEIEWDKLLEACNGNIKVLTDKKWWLVDFCSFQYGTLSEDSMSKPIMSYISLLKKHNLWKGYGKGIQKGIVTLQDKDKDKEQVKEQDKDRKITKKKYGEYKHILLTDDEYEKLKDKVDDRGKWINTVDEGIELKGYKYKSHYAAILKWYRDRDKYKSNSFTAKDKGVLSYDSIQYLKQQKELQEA